MMNVFSDEFLAANYEYLDWVVRDNIKLGAQHLGLMTVLIVLCYLTDLALYA